MKTEALIDFETAQSPTTHPSTTMKREETMNHTDTSPIKLRKNWNAREMQALFDERAGRTDPRIYTDQDLYQIELARVFSRSEETRDGQECDSPCKSRWSQEP